MDARVDQGGAPAPEVPAWRPAVVAIPAKDEVERIGACLAALAIQRDAVGAPLAEGAFTILLLANNCADGTADAVRAMAPALPHPVIVAEAVLPPGEASAGGARKRAMDLAADHLARRGAADGVILTTDADSCAGPTWMAATQQAFAAGADAVAGYIDAHPAEIVALGPAFLARGRLEDRYLRALAEIEARCDPRSHDPWPNHRVSSGASLAVTLAAYRAIGGLPACAVGEDAALSAVLTEAGFRVRHALDVQVATSCRFDGRARGGAADTMRQRHGEIDAPCDADMLPARRALWRAALKGRLRAAYRDRDPAALSAMLGARLGGRGAAVARTGSFDRFWRELAETAPALQPRAALRPSGLGEEIAAAERILRRLRAIRAPAGDRAGRCPRAGVDGASPGVTAPP